MTDQERQAASGVDTPPRAARARGWRKYWTVDPEIDVIRIYRRTGGAFDRAVELTRGADDVLTTPLLHGLEMPLAKIFSE